MQLASLGSGSRGNGTLVELGETLILVDCGFTLKQAEARFARLGVRPAELAAILVTHEHSDHAGGVAALAYKYAVPVYASWGTLKAAAGGGTSLIGSAINSHAPFSIGAVEVQPVVVPHDAREPTQFVFSCDGNRIGVISDIGHVTPFVIHQYQSLNGLLMKSNYDPAMLIRGRYPERVKRRFSKRMLNFSSSWATSWWMWICLRLWCITSTVVIRSG